MTRNPFRKALLQRTLTFGTWIQAGNAATAEILANAGYEWIVADCEHSDIDVELFANLARGMHGRGAVPLVRVRENDTLAIRQMLDMGAQGVVVPLVNNAEDAQKAVSAAKYPPLGVRGFCLSRMNNYGADFEEYVQHANDDIAVVVMIESQEAVQNINEILARNPGRGGSGRHSHWPLRPEWFVRDPRPDRPPHSAGCVPEGLAGVPGCRESGGVARSDRRSRSY